MICSMHDLDIFNFKSFTGGGGGNAGGLGLGRGRRSGSVGVGWGFGLERGWDGLRSFSIPPLQCLGHLAS